MPHALRPIFNRRASLAVGIAALLATSLPSFGQTNRDAAQTTNGTYTWSDQSNWRAAATPPPQTVPNGTNFIANFNTSSAPIGANQTVTYDLTSGATVAGIIMQGANADPGRQMIITGTGGSITLNSTTGSGRPQIQVNGTTNQEALTISANVVLADADPTDLISNASFVMSGVVSGSSAIAKSGGNTLFLGGSNTYSGNLTILNGNVLATNTAAFSSFSAGISFDGVTANAGFGSRASGTTTVSSALTFGNSTFTNTLSHGGTGSTLDLTSNSISSGSGTGAINISRFDGTDASSFGLPALSGNGSVRFSGTGFMVNRAVTINANSSLILNPASGTQTWSGNITGSGVSIEKTGAGTTVINNAIGNHNTFNGSLIVSGGTLQLGQTGAGFRGLSNVASVTVNSGGVLEFGRDAWSGSAAVTVNGTIRGISAGQTFQSFGALTLNGGTIVLTNGTAATFRQGALGSNVTVSGSSASAINSTGTTNLGFHLASNAAGVNRGFTVNDVTGNSSVDFTISANLLDSSNSAGSASLTKLGAGTMLLSGNNTYTGSTTVGAGTLRAGGVNALGGTSGITVAGGATLEVAVSGSVNDSASVALNGGSIVRSAGVSETFGALTLGANSTINFGSGVTGNLTFSGLTPASFVLSLTNFNPGNALRFASGSFNAANFNFNGFDYETSAFGSGFAITAIPEPTAIAAGVLFLTALVWRERRRLLLSSRGRRCRKTS